MTKAREEEDGEEALLGDFFAFFPKNGREKERRLCLSSFPPLTHKQSAPFTSPPPNPRDERTENGRGHQWKAKSPKYEENVMRKVI